MPYLDQASTSYPKPPDVALSIGKYLADIGVSPGRGNYHLAVSAHAMVEETRLKLANLLGIDQPEHLIFTQNATHSLNLILKGFLRENDHVLICGYSHNAALRPLQTLKEQKNISYDVVPIDEEGNVGCLEKLICSNTRLLIATEASNVIGVRADFTKAFALCRRLNLPILIDTTQSLGYLSKPYDVDFLAGTGHKTLLGPSGIGFAYIRNPDLVEVFHEGGSPGNSSLSLKHPHAMPFKFEAGTLNSVGIAGLKGALEYIEKKGFSTIFTKSLQLTEKLLQGLLEIPDITVYGTREMSKKMPIISFNLRGYLPQQVAHELDSRYQICVRAGLHCAPLIHQALKTAPTGTVRVSLGHQNTEEEISLLLHALSTLSLEGVA